MNRNSFADNLGLNAYQSAYQVTNFKNFAGNLGLNPHQNATYVPSDNGQASEAKMACLEADNHVMSLDAWRRVAYRGNRATLVNRYQK